jgi:hypothetical protein
MDHLPLWARQVGHHWFSLLEGCVATVLLGLFEKFIKPIPKLWYVIILMLFVCFASFQAWQDEYTSAQGRLLENVRLKESIQTKDADLASLKSGKTQVRRMDAGNSPGAPKKDILNLYLAIVDWQQHNPPAAGGLPGEYSASQVSEFHRRFDTKLESMADILRGRGLQDQAQGLQVLPPSAGPLYAMRVYSVTTGLKEAAAFF